MTAHNTPVMNGIEIRTKAGKNISERELTILLPLGIIPATLAEMMNDPEGNIACVIKSAYISHRPISAYLYFVSAALWFPA
jgi:hypothetical protein